MENIITFFQNNWLLILWIIVFVVVIILFISLLLYKTLSKVIPPDEEITDKRIVKLTLTDNVKFKIDLSYFINHKDKITIFIKYYGELSPRTLHVFNSDIVTLTNIGQYDFKTYLMNEIYPCRFNDEVLGYWDDDIFIITDVINKYEQIIEKDLTVD